MGAPGAGDAGLAVDTTMVGDGIGLAMGTDGGEGGLAGVEGGLAGVEGGLAAWRAVWRR